MRVVKGINWIADSIPVAPSESEAKWVTTNQRRVWLAGLMRREYPLSTPALARRSSTNHKSIAHRALGAWQAQAYPPK